MEKKVYSNIKHGHSANGKVSPTYQSWRDMKQRCQNVNCKNYEDYGGRGVKVCERWQDFTNFLADMGEKPEGLTLDRIDYNSDYEPNNCRWATRKEQRRNQRDCKTQCFFVAIRQGKVIISNNQCEFARQHGLDDRHIAACLNGKLKSHKGWRFKRIISLPDDPPFWE